MRGFILGLFVAIVAVLIQRDMFINAVPRIEFTAFNEGVAFSYGPLTDDYVMACTQYNALKDSEPKVPYYQHNALTKYTHSIEEQCKDADSNSFIGIIPDASVPGLK